MLEPRYSSKADYSSERMKYEYFYPKYCLAKHRDCSGCTFSLWPFGDTACYFKEHPEEAETLLAKIEDWHDSEKWSAAALERKKKIRKHYPDKWKERCDVWW